MHPPQKEDTRRQLPSDVHSTVEADDGNSDGDGVVIKVGTHDGILIGAAEGSAVGAVLGTDDGLLLGSTEGSEDGPEDGFPLGAELGTLGAALGVVRRFLVAPADADEDFVHTLSSPHIASAVSEKHGSIKHEVASPAQNGTSSFTWSDRQKHPPQ